MRSVFVLPLLALSLATSVAGCSKKVADVAESRFKPSEGEPLPPGPATLQIEDVVVGTGKEAHEGDKIKVLYTGTLMNGREFDSTSRRNDEPFEATLQEGALIKGWVQGMKGMRVGGKRKITIPSDLGYGAAGQPPDIPPNAGLKFEIELLEVE